MKIGKIPSHIRFIPLAVSMVLATVASVVLYRPFFILANYAWGPVYGIVGLILPASLDPIVAVLDLSLSFYLIFFLSFFFDWDEAVSYWIVGYILFMVVLFFLTAGAVGSDALGIFFGIVSASAGFIIGQGVRFLIL